MIIFMFLMAWKEIRLPSLNFVLFMEIAILMLDIPVSCSADSHMDG